MFVPQHTKTRNKVQLRVVNFPISSICGWQIKEDGRKICHDYVLEKEEVDRSYCRDIAADSGRGSSSNNSSSSNNNDDDNDDNEEENRFTNEELLNLKTAVSSFLSACAQDRDIMPNTYRIFEKLRDKIDRLLLSLLLLLSTVSGNINLE
jgi:hypothetical protein